ncbi:MAG: LPS export ABC transporter periplasmic protein LptC [Deltaproteobacteria bacterium]|nr:LPS export ABC transporter periplasmic protein LptC [Deltaproteobacteria bacterium]
MCRSIHRGPRLVALVLVVTTSSACEAAVDGLVPRPNDRRDDLVAEPVADDVELVIEAGEGELRARADHARLTSNGDVLRLEGQVRATATKQSPRAPDATGTGPRGATPSRSLDLRAERLVVDSRGRVATFEDRVELRTEGVTLACDRLIVRYDARGEAETLRASGNVRVTYPHGSAQAAVAELHVARRRLVLTGEPRLVRAGVSLVADRVEIDLGSGRATLARPRGTIALPAASGVVVP